MRWAPPELGPVPPDRLIALAEEAGLIVDVGRWVISEACRQMADWKSRGVPVPKVSVNLSASNFRDAELPAFVRGQLDQHHLKPADLTLEMTESVMLDADPRVLSGLNDFHAMGVGLSLDDFGTGYSSLACLHRLPIDELKLDRSFISDIERSHSARALIGSMLHIGSSLGLTVVAEGVETEAQQAFLRERGCQVLQGYLHSRPQDPPSLERWLAQRAPATVPAP